jgi:hypothetical protein
MSLYQQRLAENGVLTIHVSNNHLDLPPLVHRLSVDAGLASRMIQSPGEPQAGIKPAVWMVIADHQNPIFRQQSLTDALPATAEQLRSAPLWTDQCHNLVSVLRLW